MSYPNERSARLKDPASTKTQAAEASKKYNCECIKCGHKMSSDKHCADLKCPKCGGQMRRAERPGPGQDKNTAPSNACTFAQGCEISFAEKQEGQEDNRFQIIAYSGQIIPNHWLWGNIAFDLAGLRFDKSRTPILEEHFTSRRLGFSTKQDIKDKVVVEGKFLSNPAAQQIKADMTEGFPMQASVYIPPDEVEEIKEGEKAEVNGHTLKGPGTIFRKSHIREVSMCALGADSRTQSKAVGEGSEQEVQFSVLEKERIMPEEKTKIESAEMFAADYPELHSVIVTAAKAEGMAEGERAEKERFDKIKELAPDDPAFVIEQFADGKSVDEAKTNLITKLQAGAGQKQHIDPAHQEFSDQQNGPEKKEGQEGQEGQPATFDEAVEARIGADSRDVSDTKKKADAVRFCVGKYPDLHGKFLEDNRQKS